MLYDYSKHIKELAENPKKKKELEDYIHYYGEQDKLNVYQTEFYQKYLGKFEVPFTLACPERLEDDFDWDLLVKMTVGSLSSDYELLLDEEWMENPKGTPRAHLYITVVSGDQCIIKDVEELWAFQILRLFEIYVEEQIGLFSLMAEEKEDDFNWFSFDEEEENEEEENEEDEDEESVAYQQKKCMREFQRKVNLLMKEARTIIKRKGGL